MAAARWDGGARHGAAWKLGPGTWPEICGKAAYQNADSLLEWLPAFLTRRVICRVHVACDRGQLFALLGGRFGLSRKHDIPGWMKSKWFRYGFLIFFFVMFFQMLWNTYLVFAGARELRQVVTLLWTFKLPWHWAYHGTLLHPGVAQFAFGFYSVMLTSTVLGLLTMLLFKPRSWCVYCPMGTMTQLICKAKNGGRSSR